MRSSGTLSRKRIVAANVLALVALFGLVFASMNFVFPGAPLGYAAAVGLGIVVAAAAVSWRIGRRRKT